MQTLLQIWAFQQIMLQEKRVRIQEKYKETQSSSIMVGRSSAICGQSEASYRFQCLQMQVKPAQTKTQMNNPQHLVTNIEYTLKPHRKRTKFLRAKIDTCTNVNLMPISVCQLIYKDEYCTKLAPSNKIAVKTYTTEETKIIGSCKLVVVHPDTKCLQEVTFQAVNHEDSFIISCTISIDLNLIQPHRYLDVVPEEGSLIYSKADMPVKQKNKKNSKE